MSAVMSVAYNEGNYIHYIFYDKNGGVVNIISTDYLQRVIYNKTEEEKSKEIN